MAHSVVLYSRTPVMC